MVNWDNSQKIIQGSEIFQSSQCLKHENSLNDFVKSQLIMLGYTPLVPNHRAWQKDKRKIVFCLVDDFTDHANVFEPEYQELGIDPLKFYDSDTLIITDNQLVNTTKFELCRLPNSFFGMYHYYRNPGPTEYKKMLTYSVNRIDLTRITLLLELLLQLNNNLDDANVNFNCLHPTIPVNTAFAQITTESGLLKQKPEYRSSYNYIRHLMPYKNYPEFFDSASYTSAINMIAETYTTPKVITLSEKTFRGLQTPRPFSLFAGQGAVEYIRSLGFDVFDDFVDHAMYDNIYAVDADYHAKFKKFVSTTIDSGKQILTDKSLHKQFEKIADSNAEILLNFKQRWPMDFIKWWPSVLKKIQ